MSLIQSLNSGGELQNPKFIVVHYSASGDFESTCQWLCDKRSKVSAHHLIGRNEGQHAQLVPWDRVAWHCGQSSWKGLTGLNRYSIGIELVSYGPLQIRDERFFNTIDGHEVPQDEVVTARHPNGGKYVFWQGFTAYQERKLRELLHDLHEKFPSIQEVVGHYDIAPGRKQDPWPLDAKTLTLT